MHWKGGRVRRFVCSVKSRCVCPSVRFRRLSKTKTPEGDPLIYLDRDKCIGCHRCMVACPVGAIEFFPKLKSVKCDLCGGSPKCVQFCFYGCLHFIDLSEEEQAKRSKKIKTLFNKAAVEIAKQETYRRRRDFSLGASQVTPPSIPQKEEAEVSFFKEKKIKNKYLHRWR